MKNHTVLQIVFKVGKRAKAFKKLFVKPYRKKHRRSLSIDGRIMLKREI
jgi:hypothetical protein